MQPIEMPAWKLTADCIWNSFRSSGKKHLLLTGTRGIGKTTLLKKLTPAPLPGLTTRAISGKHVLLSENGTEHQTVIGLYRPEAPEGQPRMQAQINGFTGLGIDALRRCVESSSPWVSLDEIGFLETDCPEYCAALLRLFEKKQVIAVVRKQALPLLTELLAREDAFVIDLDAPFGNTGCIIMASGIGQRFGSNKLMTDFHGEPMIARALAATACVPHRVVVTRHAEVADYCRARALPVVLHDLPYRSDTVRLGLEALTQTDACFFCPGDQPLLSEETVMSLALLGTVLQSSILRPAAGDQPGAPILFPRRFYPELLALPQGKGGSYVARQHPGQVYCLPVRDSRELADADTPEALKALL